MKQFLKSKNIVVLALIVSLIIFLPSVNATTIDYYRIGNTINNDFSITTVMLFKFSDPITNLDYELDYLIYDLTASSNFDYVDCKKIDISGRSKISCDFVGMTEEKNFLSLQFKTREGIKRIAEGYELNVNYNIPLPVKEMFVVIGLPERATLIKEPATESIYPKDGKTITGGKKIDIFWEKKKLEPGTNLRFSVSYSMPESPVFLILSLTIIVITIMLSIAFYIKKMIKSKNRDIVSVLNSDEKIIVDILKNHNNDVFQKVLVRESDFSKAKVSRLVKTLKERGIIDIEPVSGRENKIILKIK